MPEADKMASTEELMLETDRMASIQEFTPEADRVASNPDLKQKPMPIIMSETDRLASNTKPKPSLCQRVKEWSLMSCSSLCPCR